LEAKLNTLYSLAFILYAAKIIFAHHTTSHGGGKQLKKRWIPALIPAQMHCRDRRNDEAGDLILACAGMTESKPLRNYL